MNVQILCGLISISPMHSYNVAPPFTIAKLLYNSHFTIWFMIPITIVFMGFINQLITGGLTMYGKSSFFNISGVIVG